MVCSTSEYDKVPSNTILLVKLQFYSVLMYWCADVCIAVYITVSLYIDDVLMSILLYISLYHNFLFYYLKTAIQHKIGSQIEEKYTQKRQDDWKQPSILGPSQQFSG